MEEIEKPEESLVITPRDVDLLRMIHEHRYSPYNHIETAFWPGRSTQANGCYRRIEILVDGGYLARDRSRKNGQVVYLLAQKGFQELKTRGLDQGLVLYRKTKDFDRNIDHDLKVLTLRIKFREMGIHDWRCERILKEKDYLKRIPDGVVLLKGKYNLAIELENSLKTKSRYREIFSYYRENKDYSLILFVVDDELKEWLIAMDYDPQRVWFAGYTDLLKMKERTVFENRHERFEFSRILTR